MASHMSISVNYLFAFEYRCRFVHFCDSLYAVQLSVSWIVSSSTFVLIVDRLNVDVCCWCGVWCCVVIDGSHQGDDRRVESYQRDCVHEAKTVGSSQARNIPRWLGAGWMMWQSQQHSLSLICTGIMFTGSPSFVSPFIRTDVVNTISDECLEQFWWDIRGIFTFPYWWPG